MVNRKKNFNNVAIFSSIRASGVRKISDQIEEILIHLDVKVTRIFGPNTRKDQVKPSSEDKFVLKNCDLIIAVGGDGTLLGAARKFGFNGIPVLGINLGTLGFLTDIAPNEITSNLKSIIFGKFIKDDRFFLEAQVNGKAEHNIALNEVTLHAKSISTLIEYEVYIDKYFVFRQKADGIIVNTPTGSTAYSLSGNGPIVHPKVKSITLLPMFPHSLNTRPLIVNEDSEIEIIIKGDRKVGLSLDNHKIISLKKEDSILISKAKSKLCLIHPEDHDFYKASRNKLGWSLGIVQNHS